MFIKIHFSTNAKRVLSCYFYNILELLAVKTSFFNNLLLGWRQPVFINEIKMSKITSKDKVLLIGCGIFPSETIVIAQETNAQVVGIDNAPNVVKIAKKYIKKIGLSHLIRIKYADGVDFDVKEFDVIFIAINVFPINNVLKHLSKKLKKGTRIMCKSIKHDIPLVLKTEKMEDIFKIIGKLENPKTQSYLLIKK